MLFVDVWIGNLFNYNKLCIINLGYDWMIKIIVYSYWLDVCDFFRMV